MFYCLFEHGTTSAITFLIVTVMTTNVPIILGQMDYYNNQYDAQAAYCQSSGAYGSARDCGYGTRNQNWFGTYQLGKANPYQFVSTMPYGSYALYDDISYVVIKNQ